MNHQHAGESENPINSATLTAKMFCFKLALDKLLLLMSNAEISNLVVI